MLAVFVIVVVVVGDADFIIFIISRLLEEILNYPPIIYNYIQLLRITLHIIGKGSPTGILYGAGLTITAYNSANTNINIDVPNFDPKLDLITSSVRPFVREHLLTKITRGNCVIIINYILPMQTELNISQI